MIKEKGDCQFFAIDINIYHLFSIAFYNIQKLYWQQKN